MFSRHKANLKGEINTYLCCYTVRKFHVMKSVFMMVTLVLFFGCSEAPKKEKNTSTGVDNVEQFKSLTTLDRNGKYIEWYPGHKQIKIEGRKDDQGRRQGVWKLYTQEGIEMSVTVYKDGQKDGHIIVRYPTGILRYTGQYDMDERIGEWKFYDQSGQLTKTENFSKGE